MMALVQALIQFGVIPFFKDALPLPITLLIMLIGTTVFLAAGGYVINELYDIEADTINKPKKVIVGSSLSRKRTLHYYALLTLTGLLLGALLCYTAKRPLPFFLFITIVILLYGYARYFKRLALIGNLLVSLLVAFTVIVMGLFTFSPYVDETRFIFDIPYIQVLWYVSVFSGLLTFLRELVKDLQDIKGDYASKYLTLPIILGIERTARLTAAFALGSLFTVALFSFTTIHDNIIVQAALILGVVSPLGYVASRLWEAQHQKEFAKISRYIKVIMIIGLALIPFIAKNIANAQG